MRWIIPLIAFFASLGPAHAANQVSDYYDDPFAYCAAAGTVARPGPHYTDPVVPDVIIAAINEEVDPDRLVWRCSDGRVFACFLLSTRPCDVDVIELTDWSEVAQGGSNGGVDTVPVESAGSASSADQFVVTQVNAGGLRGGMPEIYASYGATNFYFYGFCDGNHISLTADARQGGPPLTERLLDQTWVMTLIRGAASEAVRYCEQRQNTSVVGVAFKFLYDRQQLEADSSDGGQTWQVSNPFQREQAVANVAASKLSRFTSEFSVQQYVNLQTYESNPFLYEGQVIGIPLKFVRMISNQSAIFQWSNSYILLDSVPTTQFSDNRTALVALRGVGTHETNALGNSVILPYGNYVGVGFCEDSRCKDYFAN